MALRAGELEPVAPGPGPGPEPEPIPVAKKEDLAKFETGLATELGKDGYANVMRASMCVRERPKGESCEVCGIALNNKHLAFRIEGEPKVWHRVCVNRPRCRTIKAKPPDLDPIQTGGAWEKRVSGLYLDVTM